MPLLDNDRWGALRAFEAVGRSLNFAAAAESLNLSVSALSRRIRQLEERLGCQLLQRTTRHVTLTEVGALYLERCRMLLEQAEEMDALASKHMAEPRGTLRVSLPNLYGQRCVAPLLPEFLERHPHVQMQLMLSDGYVDLVAARIDVGVRIGALANGEYVARRLADNERMICAAPSYLARHGRPKTPRDLTDHACLHFSPLIDGRIWRLSRGARTVEIAIQPLLSADNAEVLRQAALAGRGLALLGDFLVGEDVAAGRLVPVLTDWKPTETSIHLVYPAARYLPLKTRAFADFLIEKLGTTNRPGLKGRR